MITPHWPAVLTERNDADAVRLLDRYFSRRIDGSPRFTGSYFERIATDRNAGPDQHALTSDDFVAVGCLSVEVPAAAAIRLLERQRADITALLEAIPPKLDLMSAGDTDLNSDSALHRLWWLLRDGGDGLGPTTTSKLLARKRPALAPIWDRAVEHATEQTTATYWRWLREQLSDTDADGHSQWQWLGDVVDQVPDAAHVTPLRALDICIWLTDWERRNPA